MLCGTFLNFNIHLVFKDGLTQTEYKIVHVLMQLLTINLALSFPMSVFQNIISANERFIVLKLIGMIKTVLGPLVTLPLLLMGYRSIALVSVTFVLSILADCLYVYYVFYVLHQRFVFRNFEHGILKELFSYTAFIAINAVIDQINLNIDKILLARFKGTTQVSIYSVGYAMYSYYQMFSTSVSNVFIPRIHHIVATTKDSYDSQKQQLTEIFVKVGRIQFIILGLVLSGFILFGHSFITGYWADYSYSKSYYVALLLMVPAIVPLTQNLGIEIQRALNKHQFRSIVYMFMALCNLTLSIYLCQIYGAVGSAVGTAISLVLANGVIMNIYYHKKCNIDIILFWRNIIRLLIVMIVPVGIGFWIVKTFDLFKFGMFLIALVIYIASFLIAMWFLGMNDFEKNIVRSFCGKIKKAMKKRW